MTAVSTVTAAQLVTMSIADVVVPHVAKYTVSHAAGVAAIAGIIPSFYVHIVGTGRICNMEGLRTFNERVAISRGLIIPDRERLKRMIEWNTISPADMLSSGVLSPQEFFGLLTEMVEEVVETIKIIE